MVFDIEESRVLGRSSDLRCNRLSGVQIAIDRAEIDDRDLLCSGQARGCRGDTTKLGPVQCEEFHLGIFGHCRVVVGGCKKVGRWIEVGDDAIPAEEDTPNATITFGLREDQMRENIFEGIIPWLTTANRSVIE